MTLLHSCSPGTEPPCPSEVAITQQFQLYVSTSTQLHIPTQTNKRHVIQSNPQFLAKMSSKYPLSSLLLLMHVNLQVETVTSTNSHRSESSTNKDDQKYSNQSDEHEICALNKEVQAINNGHNFPAAMHT